ncbi:MAG: hypothetical protein EXR63_05870 [Dehalococcoidia bacterium]|nr:hypothetical protein [Dehalococcoidia bacterium]
MSETSVDLDVVRELACAFAEREARDSEAYPAANVADLHRASLLGAPFAAALVGGGAARSLVVAAVR